MSIAAEPQLMTDLRSIAEEAGHEIMKIYRMVERNVTAKSDLSPLTQADLNANRIIVSGLEKLTAETIVSEEGDRDGKPLVLSGAGRGPEAFWLVDPLDGTRDFVGHLDTFVICIARVVAH